MLQYIFPPNLALCQRHNSFVLKSRASVTRVCDIGTKQGSVWVRVCKLTVWVREFTLLSLRRTDKSAQRRCVREAHLHFPKFHGTSGSRDRPWYSTQHFKFCYTLAVISLFKSHSLLLLDSPLCDFSVSWGEHSLCSNCLSSFASWVDEQTCVAPSLACGFGGTGWC